VSALVIPLEARGAGRTQCLTDMLIRAGSLRPAQPSLMRTVPLALSHSLPSAGKPNMPFRAMMVPNRTTQLHVIPTKTDLPNNDELDVNQCAVTRYRLRTGQTFGRGGLHGRAALSV
jgi:hypothetical protein